MSDAIQAIQVSVGIRRSDEPQRDTTAWLIHGSDSRAWVEEIAAWQLDDRKLKLHVMPVSREDTSPAGLFVITGDGGIPAKTPAAVPFGLATRGLYVPVHAVVSPALKDGEWEALVSYPTVVFQPGEDPVAFEAEDCLALSDLLFPTAETQTQWVVPPLETEPHPRIESIALRPMPLSLEDLFGSESEDIGSEPPKELSEKPEPPKRSFMDGLRAAGMKITSKLLTPTGPGKGSAGGGSGKTPLSGLKKWLEDRLQPPSKQQEQARDKALRDLLEQLQKNPDEGLKHALPLASAFLNRGFAAPGTSLGTRNTDFSMRRLGGSGGGAVDPWNIQEEYRKKLRERYLALAEREKQNGRYRRAAYIYSELLGDLTSCASVLVEGKFWHEAALIYRDHLHSPMEAARCFVEARMIPDAVAIYKKENAHEELGELYRKLGEEENAAAAFREWVNQLKDARKMYDAAHVLEERLAAREEAMGVLESTWPNHPDMKRCVEKLLLMHGNAGTHEDASRLVRKFAADPVPSHGTTELLRIFASLQSNYPDRSVRGQAEDCGRQMIARILGSKDSYVDSFRHDMARMLPSLAPDDRLLGRDVLRFTSKPKPPAKKPIAPQHKRVETTGSHAIGIGTANTFQLPQLERGQWLKAVISTNGMWAMGFDQRKGQLQVTRADFEGHHQSCTWDDRLDLAQATSGNALLAICRGSREMALPSVMGAAPLKAKTLDPAVEFKQHATVGAPSWLSAPILAMTYTENDVLWVARDTPTGILISGFAQNGKIIANIPAPLPAEILMEAMEEGAALPAMGVHLASVRQHLVFAIGNALFVCLSSPGAAIPSPVLVTKFSEPILGLEPSRPLGAPHVKVQLASEIALCWLESQPIRVQTLDVHLPGAVSGFTSEGNIVALTPEAGYIFAANSKGAVKSCRFLWKQPVPVAVGPGPIAGTFCAVSAAGFVTIYNYATSGLK